MIKRSHKIKQRVVVSALFVFALLFHGVNSNALSLLSLSEIEGPASGGDEIILTGQDFIRCDSMKFKYINAGLNSGLAISNTGKTYVWGENSSGQLGLGDKLPHYASSGLTELNIPNEKITKASFGNSMAIVLTESGKVFSMGSNSFGKLGDGTEIDSTTPVDITSSFGGEKVIKTSHSNATSLAVTESGKVYSWGRNTDGLLGLGSTDNNYYVSVPSQITSLSGVNIVDVVADYYSSYVISDTGKVYSWGDNVSGQLGIGSDSKRYSPQLVTANIGSEEVVKLTKYHNTVFALARSGKVFSWGQANDGVLGRESSYATRYTSRYQPNEITDLSDKNIVDIAEGFAMSETGDVYYWGFYSMYNGNYVTGDGTTAQHDTPVIHPYLRSDQVSQMIYNSGGYTVLDKEGNIIILGNKKGAGAKDSRVDDKTPVLMSGIPSECLPVVDSVYFGSSKVDSLEVIDENTIKLIVPPHTAGKVDVIIKDVNGDEDTLYQYYEYLEDKEAQAPTIPPGKEDLDHIEVPNTGAERYN